MGGHNFQILPKLTCWRLHGYRIHWHMKWFLYLHRWRWWNLGGVFKIHVISVQTQRKILIPASQKYHISGSLNKGKNMYETQFEIKLTETNIRQKEVYSYTMDLYSSQLVMDEPFTALRKITACDAWWSSLKINLFIKDLFRSYGTYFQDSI